MAEQLAGGGGPRHQSRTGTHPPNPSTLHGKLSREPNPTTAHPGPAERSCRGSGNARSILHSIGDQHSRDTVSMLSTVTTQSGGSRRESSPMLLLGRGKHHCAASRLSSGGAQPTWIRKLSTTTSLAETHGTVSRGSSASTQRPRCLSPQLGRQTEPRSRLQSHKVPSPHLTSLQQMLPRPPGEGWHRSWWETIVTLCRTAQNKGKSWPESHDRAIREVADSWEHPDWLVVLENLRYIRDHPEGPPERWCSRPYKLQQVAWHNQSRSRSDHGYLWPALASPGRLFPA